MLYCYGKGDVGMGYDYSKLTRRQISESISLLKNNLEQVKKYYIDDKERIYVDDGLLQVLIQDIVKGEYKLSNELLRVLDLSLINFSGISVAGVDFSGTNANIDPQTVKFKSLAHTNLNGIDMSAKCFDDCCLMYSNLSNTNANINPQKIYENSLYGTNLENVDLSDKCFDDVCVAEANLEGTNADINPQTVKNKILYGTNLSGLDMSAKCFDECDVRSAILIDTGADITIYDNDYYRNYIEDALMYGCNIVDERKKISNFIRSLRKK